MNAGEIKRGFASGMAVSEAYDETVLTIDKPFGRALIEVASRRPDVVGMTADLGKYTDIDIFGQRFPERYFQVGMAEQNLVGVAAGLAKTGFTPFATSYCSFLPRRAYDFIAIAVAEARANVKLVAALPGLTTSYGATHQGIDDLALMRAVPNMVVVDPCDATEIQQAVAAIADYEGPVYLRILRGRVKQVFDPASYRFELGKAQRLRHGKDVLLVTTGLMTDRALQAAVLLSKEGIEASVLHVSTLKPFDEDAAVAAAAEAGTVVTLENHTIRGGLGSAVAEALCRSRVVVRMRMIGVPDCFVECGSVPYLTDKHGLSVGHVVRSVKELLQ
jgi:transketolase